MCFLNTAQADPFYYGNLSENSPSLKNDLYTILVSAHTPIANNSDLLTSECSAPTCFKYTPLSYYEARSHLFGSLHLLGDSFENFSVMTSYCQKTITNTDLSAERPLGVLLIPDYNVVNTEHVWPQSKFSKNFTKAEQKPNLHILLPELSSVNTTRSNHPMGLVVQTIKAPCAEARLGKNAQGYTVFEPSSVVQGNVARALFYFSVRFKMPINQTEESVLRTWHINDPPDAFEKWRNEEIFLLQKDRNPFIDKPELVDKIQDF